MQTFIHPLGVTVPISAQTLTIKEMLVGDRLPDEIIDDGAAAEERILQGLAPQPYLLRWFVKRTLDDGNVYLHCFLRSDFDRALHDHPWDSTSILLDGTYTEHTPEGAFVRKPGDHITRKAEDAHRIELTDGPCWTLFITGKKRRTWGFHCPDGWVRWTEFVAAKCGASS